MSIYQDPQKEAHKRVRLYLGNWFKLLWIGGFVSGLARHLLAVNITAVLKRSVRTSAEAFAGCCRHELHFQAAQFLISDWLFDCNFLGYRVRLSQEARRRLLNDIATLFAELDTKDVSRFVSERQQTGLKIVT